MITNRSLCSSHRRQDLVCSFLTRGQSASYLQVLHVMVSQGWDKPMWRWEVCLVLPESRRTAQVIPCENRSSLMHGHRNQAQIRAFHQRDWTLWCKRLSFVSRCLPGRMEPAGQGMNLSNPFSWLIQLAGSSREHPLSHSWMLFHLFNVLMFSHTFTPSLQSIALSSGLQEYYHRSIIWFIQRIQVYTAVGPLEEWVR